MEEDSYKKRVERAYLAAQEVLGSLAVASEQVAVDVEKGVQEVEVKCYDSDSLSSPPPSSDESDRDLDPLLDFSRNDDLTHQHGTEGPAMVRSAIHAQRALEGIQSITRGVQERRQNEEEKSRLVSTQAMFTPVFPKSGEARWQPAAKQPQDRDGSNPWQRAKPQQETTGPPPVTKTELSAERQLSEMAPYSRDGAKSHEVIPDRPPPIPSYNPERPDSFLLSNKPEYQIADRKKTSHTYNPTNREEVVTVQPQGEAKASRMNVPMRTKKKAADQMPAPGREGYVADPKRKQKSFLSHSVHASDEIMDIDGEMACMGLPKDVRNWRHKEVGLWLKQLSVTIYGLYSSCFSKHDVTGRTLLRLNESKLRAMDITTPNHCRLLAMQITKLKIQQEALELSELRKDIQQEALEDAQLSEDDELTYL